MKLAFAGKGGVGKTTLAAWMGDYLARQGRDVWLVDADTALSLGRACGLERADLPTPLIEREDLVRERIGEGMMHLNPDVSDLPENLAVDLPPVTPAPGDAARPGRRRLLLMGSVAGAGGGCACSANALLKALLAHLVLDRDTWLLVDLEAGVEHLGRGTVSGVDGLVVVSDPSRRGLETGAEVGRMAADLGLARQVLVVNRLRGGARRVPNLPGLPTNVLASPPLEGLEDRQLDSPSVLGLPEQAAVDTLCAGILEAVGKA
ncbi:Cobyrinic acid ac-diamide synthase [Desulfovibrio sp. X2]|uniref:ATP-binding protein n=1 Tax=Desulfovibrio sp. X2 TaxID=941449 RepID=UPI000358D58E|nr:AAA family ATPase [Desulfovibrio sp. X2]EPR43175.1 Cobyrinic acid ac-diamide synthase [Desulfovibrio sp. X2]